VSYGMWLMMVVPDAPRFWDHGQKLDTPAESIYSTYQPLQLWTEKRIVAPLPEGIPLEQAIRRTMVSVLPVPGPATTRSGPSVVVTAFCWASFRPSNISECDTDIFDTNRTNSHPFTAMARGARGNLESQEHKINIGSIAKHAKAAEKRQRQV